MILEVLGIVVPAITTLLAFWLGTAVNKSSRKIEQAEHELSVFYVPFIKEYILNGAVAVPFSSMGEEAKSKIINLLLDNYCFLPDDVQGGMYQWVLLMTASEEYTSGIWGDGRTSDDEMFLEFSNSIYKQYKKLCQKLKYPEQSEFFLPIYFEPYEQK